MPSNFPICLGALSSALVMIQHTQRKSFVFLFVHRREAYCRMGRFHQCHNRSSELEVAIVSMVRKEEDSGTLIVIQGTAQGQNRSWRWVMKIINSELIMINVTCFNNSQVKCISGFLMHFPISINHTEDITKYLAYMLRKKGSETRFGAMFV